MMNLQVAGSLLNLQIKEAAGSKKRSGGIEEKQTDNVMMRGELQNTNIEIQRKKLS